MAHGKKSPGQVPGLTFFEPVRVNYTPITATSSFTAPALFSSAACS